MKKMLTVLWIIALIGIVLIIFCLFGFKQDKDDQITGSGRFECIEDNFHPFSENYNERIIRDRETDVLYLALYGGYRFGITPLLNADGTPILYKEYLEAKTK